MVLFFDTNALLKHYLAERGSSVVDIILSDPRFTRGRLTSTAVILEAHAVLAREWRGEQLSDAAYGNASHAIERDRSQIWTVLPTEDDDILEARAGILRFPERSVGAFDHVHIETALRIAQGLRTVDELVLVSSDKKLLSYATLRGLRCFDPEKDPPSALR